MRRRIDVALVRIPESLAWPEAVHIIAAQGRRGVKSHRRQLGRIPKQHEAAVVARAHEIHEIFQQVACAEKRLGLLGAGVNANKRHLVHHEQRMLCLVGRKRKLPVAVRADRFLAVDMLVDRGSRPAGNASKNLGRTARGSQQHRLDAEAHKIRDDGGNGRGLAGAGIAVQYENVAVVGAKERSEVAEKSLLTGRRFHPHLSQKAFRQSLGIHQRLRLSNNIATTASTG